MDNEQIALAITQVQFLLNSDEDISERFFKKYKENLVRVNEVAKIEFSKMLADWVKEGDKIDAEK